MPVQKSQHITNENFICTIDFWYMRSLICWVLFLIACSDKQTPDALDSKQTDSLSLPQVTYLADLPDSLQPKVTYLDQGPKPVTKIFPIPTPTRTFIDPLTGRLLPPDVHGEGFFTAYTTGSSFKTIRIGKHTLRFWAAEQIRL